MFLFKGKQQKMQQIVVATKMFYVAQKMAFIIVAMSYSEEASSPFQSFCSSVINVLTSF